MCDRPPIRVIVNGATGKMGLEVIKALANESDMRLVGAIAHKSHQGRDIGKLAGCGTLGVKVTKSLQKSLAMAAQEESPAVMVDFTRVDPTHPDLVYENIRSAIAAGVRPVVGTTGLKEEQIQKLDKFAKQKKIGCLIIPNFSIGMMIMQQAAIQAAKFQAATLPERHFKHVEIIELHHNQKVDAPSGTAIETAKRLGELGQTFNPPSVDERETMPGARGCVADENIRIHSLRLPGYLAQQEIIFGASGEIYKLYHDVSNRSCYMPGVLIAIRKILDLKSLVRGLETIALPDSSMNYPCPGS